MIYQIYQLKYADVSYDDVNQVLTDYGVFDTIEQCVEHIESYGNEINNEIFIVCEVKPIKSIKPVIKLDVVDL